MSVKLHQLPLGPTQTGMKFFSAYRGSDEMTLSEEHAVVTKAQLTSVERSKNFKMQSCQSATTFGRHGQTCCGNGLSKLSTFRPTGWLTAIDDGPKRKRGRIPRSPKGGD